MLDDNIECSNLNVTEFINLSGNILINGRRHTPLPDIHNVPNNTVLGVVNNEFKCA